MSINEEVSSLDIKNILLNNFCISKISDHCDSDGLALFRDLFENKCIKKVLEDNELMETVDLFFENNLNISSTSKIGYMHRNTLIYRLDKIKNFIGLDIRIFNEAVVFKNFIIFYNLFNNK